MLATFNLQISSTSTRLDGALGPGVSGFNAHTDHGSSPVPFANLLKVPTDVAPFQAANTGENLPLDGKPLPTLVPPNLPEDLIPPKISASTPVTGIADDSVIRNADYLEPELRADLGRDMLATQQPQVDLELDLELTYPPTEPVAGEFAGVNLLPVASPHTNPMQSPISDAAVPANRAVDAPLPTVPRTPLETRLTTPAATQPDAPVALATEQVIAVPAAERPVRQSNLAPVAAVGKPAVTVIDTALSADDSVDDDLMPLLSRTIGALETVQKPDTRVSAVSTSHNPVAVNLPSNVSGFNIDLANSRSESMLDTITTPVRDNAWGQKLGERVLMMTGKQLQTAEIRLTPADLGPVRVRVSVEEGAAHVTFHAQNAVTRDAIEQAMPRLRDMLSENGLSLGQTDVSDHGVADGRDDRDLDGGTGMASTDEQSDAEPEIETAERRKTVASDNLLDTFA